MKPIIIFAFLGLFNYGSMEQAKQACNEWTRNGGTYTEEWTYHYQETIKTPVTNPVLNCITKSGSKVTARPWLENRSWDASGVYSIPKTWTCTEDPEKTYTSYMVEQEPRTRTEERERDVRYCKHEEPTNQYVGIEERHNGKPAEYVPLGERTEERVMKHFRY